MTPEYGVSLVPWCHYILRFLTSFIAAYGFAMLFNSPQRVCATAAVIGAVINTARIALHLELGVPAPACVGLAALAAGLAVRGSVGRGSSRVTLSVPAVVMIPGVPLYRALTYLNNQQIDDALAALFTVMFTIVAIGMGLALPCSRTELAHGKARASPEPVGLRGRGERVKFEIEASLKPPSFEIEPTATNSRRADLYHDRVRGGDRSVLVTLISR